VKLLGSHQTLHWLHMVVVFQGKRVNRGIYAQRLTYRDTLSASADSNVNIFSELVIVVDG